MCSAGTCHWLAGGCDRARVFHSRRSRLVWSDVSLAPLSFASRLQAATFRAVVDSALQSVHNGSTTGCRQVRQPACCNSRHAMTLHWGVRSFHPGIAHRRRQAPVPRVGLTIVALALPARGGPGLLRGGGPIRTAAAFGRRRLAAGPRRQASNHAEGKRRSGLCGPRGPARPAGQRGFRFAGSRPKTSGPFEQSELQALRVDL